MRTILATAGVIAAVVSLSEPVTPQSAGRETPPAGLDDPRPIEALDTVFTEEMTWMEVRDAIRAGKTTAIVATGGVEQNGPHVATGKHNYVLRATTEAIARKLGNALVSPVIPFVPEGSIDPPSGHMWYPGTISLREETFQALLKDVCASLKQHGFLDIVLIGEDARRGAAPRGLSGGYHRRGDPEGDDRRRPLRLSRSVRVFHSERSHPISCLADNLIILGRLVTLAESSSIRAADTHGSDSGRA